MKQLILDLLNDSRAYTVKEITDALDIPNENETRQILSEMCDSLDLFKTKKNKYILFSNCPLKKGTISIAKAGYGFVNFGESKDAFIPARNLNGAMDGDTVAIEIVNRVKDKVEAKVVKVVAHDLMPLVGEIVIKRKKTYILLDNNKNNLKVVLDGQINGMVDGTKVVVSLKDKIDKDTYTAEVVEVLGHKDDPGVDLKSIVRQYNIPDVFPAEVEETLKNIPDEVTEDVVKEMLAKGAKDLRNENIFTIDGDDTKDIDDAASIKILPNGNYELSIHIANVSHYVPIGSPIWENAMSRGTSVYIPGASIPMLPRKLSNGICSLNPEVDRLALTFQMEIDHKGHVVNFDTFESIINSRKQMTYKNVNKILEQDIVPEGYEPFVEDLKMMQGLAHILRVKKVKRGFIDFEIDENKIEVDKSGKPVNVTLRPRGEAEKLIEDFMVQTGESASCYLDIKDEQKEEPTSHVYRVHGDPKEEKIINLKAFLSALNYKTKHLDELSPLHMQMLLEEMKDKKEYLIIARELLRCMQKAIYSTKNIGHFALASLSDCQVTSPIRRAGDLVNHVLIKENIYEKKSNINWKKQMPLLAANASATERNADSCEKAADKMKMAEYMQDHIGEEFEGMITSLTKFGFFVELPNLIDGFVNIQTLTDDKYIYDQDKFCFVGRDNHKKYRLGDRVTVRVIDANKAASTIDFEIKSKEDIKVKKLTNFK